jgi:hypothetical protein
LCYASRNNTRRVGRHWRQQAIIVVALTLAASFRGNGSA